MPRTKKRGAITEEELMEIRIENQRKLDEIMAIPNYIEVIARKWYGDDWLRTLGSDYYIKADIRKESSHKNMKRQREEGYQPRIPATTLPIIELTLDGQFIKEWDNIKEWRDENSTKHYITPIQCAQGKAPSAYGKKWKFKKDYENGQ